MTEQLKNAIALGITIGVAGTILKSTKKLKNKLKVKKLKWK